MILAPSILASDFSRLKEEVDAVLDAGADWIHVDVMDGMFVPNITIGPPVVASLRKHLECVLDVHLMIVNPERYVEDFVNAGASVVTVHTEATPHVHRVLQQVKRLGAKAGLALNPATNLDCLDYVADDIDLLLVMTVNPGFGGQSYIKQSTDKVRAARHRLAQLGRSDVLIEVDGGITKDTIGLATGAGANVCVAGSSVFSQASYQKAIDELRAAVLHPKD